MIRPSLLAPVLALVFAFGLAGPVATSPAGAAKRTYSIGSFDRVRVEGPFDVRLATGTSPGASAEGDPRTTDDLDIRVEGTTLIVRAGTGGWGERPPATDAHAPIIRISTLMIRSAVLVGGGRLTMAGPIRGQRVDLSLTGSGSLIASGLAADELYVNLYGSGTVALAGTAAKVRLITSGQGVIDATPLSAGDLTIRLDGTGETRASARFTASIVTTGIGAATVYGKPACTVKALAGGPISCGKLLTPPSPPKTAPAGS
jgi:hypothetical protein